MDDLIRNLVARELAPQRSISLYKDQEQLIKDVSDKYGVNLSMANIVREGVDLALKKVKDELSN